MNQTLGHRPTSEICINALDSLLLQKENAYVRLILSSLANIFFYPEGAYPDFLEELFSSHSVLSLKFVVSISDLKRDLVA